MIDIIAQIFALLFTLLVLIAFSVGIIVAIKENFGKKLEGKK